MPRTVAEAIPRQHESFGGTDTRAAYTVPCAASEQPTASIAIASRKGSLGGAIMWETALQCAMVLSSASERGQVVRRLARRHLARSCETVDAHGEDRELSTQDYRCSDI